MADDMIEAEGSSPSNVILVAISKGRSGTIEVDTGKLAEYVYIQALKDGVKVRVNSGMSKLVKENYKTFEDFQEAVRNKARENLEAMYAGTITIRGSTATKGDSVPREVKTLARNMARAIVKAELKKKGYKLSLIKTPLITKAANDYMTANPGLIQKAAKQLEEQNAAAQEVGGVDISGISEDAELAAKAAKAKQAKQLSADKAGRIASRGQPTRR